MKVVVRPGTDVLGMPPRPILERGCSGSRRPVPTKELVPNQGSLIFWSVNRAPAKITMIAAAFPMLQDQQLAREAELERLLQDVIPETEEELDVPAYLRQNGGSRSRGFIR